jgi:hypothetical protein
MHACLYHLVRKCTVRVNLKMTRGRPSRCCRLALSLSLAGEMVAEAFIRVFFVNKKNLINDRQTYMHASAVGTIYIPYGYYTITEE